MKGKIHWNVFLEWIPLLAVNISLCWAYSVALLLWHRSEVAKQSFAASFWSLPKLICFLSRSTARHLTEFFRPTCLGEENVYLVNCERFFVFRAGHWGQKSHQLGIWMSMLAVIGVHFANICLMCVTKTSRFCDRLLYYFIYLFLFLGRHGLANW